MKLIINADDFGLSKSITDGIIEDIKGGYITSTSIMANMEYTEYAVKEAINNNIDCIGLHINLTVGKPIIENDNLIDDNGIFLYNRKQIENPKLTYDDAYNEIIAQIKKSIANISSYADDNVSDEIIDEYTSQIILHEDFIEWHLSCLNELKHLARIEDESVQFAEIELTKKDIDKYMEYHKEYSRLRLKEPTKIRVFL